MNTLNKGIKNLSKLPLLDKIQKTPKKSYYAPKSHSESYTISFIP